jgi:hypothetical protein
VDEFSELRSAKPEPRIIRIDANLKDRLTETLMTEKCMQIESVETFQAKSNTETTEITEKDGQVWHGLSSDCRDDGLAISMEGFARTGFDDQIVLPLSVSSAASVLKEVACKDATGSANRAFFCHQSFCQKNQWDSVPPRKNSSRSATRDRRKICRSATSPETESRVTRYHLQLPKRPTPPMIGGGDRFPPPLPEKTP